MINILSSNLLNYDADISKQFDDVRLKRLQNYTNEYARNEAYTSGVLINQIKPEGVKILYNEFGKPFFDCETPYFSVSHSGGYVYLAYSDESIAIDFLEFNRKSSEKILKKICTTEELLVVNSISEDIICKEDIPFVIFSRKEAVSKFIGMGLKLDFKKILDYGLEFFDFNKVSKVYVNDGRNKIDLYIKTIKVHEGYLSIVCDENNLDNLENIKI